MFGASKDQGPDMAAPAESRRRGQTKFDEAAQVVDTDAGADKSLLGSWVSSAPSPQFGPIDASQVASHGKAYAPPQAMGHPPAAEASFLGIKMSRSTMLIGLGALLVLACGYAIFFRGSSQGSVLPVSYEEDGDGEDYVIVSGTHFELDCRPFYVAGFNAHDLMPKALATPEEHKTTDGKTGEEMIREMFYNASQFNLNTVRVYAHTTDPDHRVQISPGKVDHDVLYGLDFVLDEARIHGFKVIISLVDNWKYPGGVDEYMDWSKSAPKRKQHRPADQAGDFDDQGYSEKMKEYEVGRHALFFSDKDSKALYKQFAKTVIMRRNIINGRIYRDDPTIMAWSLINEPRCETWKVPECSVIFPQWVDEMSTYVKSLDANHLVTVGEEGFFSTNEKNSKHNPQKWGEEIGQSFATDHLAANVDFATVHIWPDNWERSEDTFATEWLEAHMDEAEKKIGKPLLLQEFGKRLTKSKTDAQWQDSIDMMRNPVFADVYGVVNKALAQNRALRGVLFWRWDLNVYAGMPAADYGLLAEDTTFDIIRDNAAKVKSLMVSVPPAPSCKLGCWVPAPEHVSSKKTINKCVNDQQVCVARQRELQKAGGKLSLEEESMVFASEAACCRPGLGAFEKGCSRSSKSNNRY